MTLEPEVGNAKYKVVNNLSMGAKSDRVSH
jgi:hypothetical protein